MNVKTIKAARELPEVVSSMFTERRETRPGGVTVIHSEVNPISATPISGDSIILFVDIDGRAMSVVNTPQGLRKTEFRL